MNSYCIEARYRAQGQVALYSLLGFSVFLFLDIYFSFDVVEIDSVEVGVFAFFTLLTIIALISYFSLDKYEIIANEDGLWYHYLGADKGLVKYDDIAQIKPRQQKKRLDLYDKEGEHLLSVHYQLNEFNILRAILAEKTGKVDGVVSTEMQRGILTTTTKYEKYVFVGFAVIAFVFGVSMMVSYFLNPYGGLPKREVLTEVQGRLVWLDRKSESMHFLLSNSKHTFRYSFKSQKIDEVYKALSKALSRQVVILAEINNAGLASVDNSIRYGVFEISIEGKPIRTYVQTSKAWIDEQKKLLMLAIAFMLGGWMMTAIYKTTIPR